MPRSFRTTDNLLTNFLAHPVTIANPGGQRMGLDLLVASGLALPTLLYGLILFANYLQ